MMKKSRGIKQSLASYQIEGKVLEEMISYSKENLPYEACGLISGEKDQGSTLWKMENESKSPFRFSMSEEAVSSVLGKMKEQEEELTGIFHSHPHTPASPSEKDIRFNPYPELAYFIVSLAGSMPEVRCIRMGEEQVEELALEIVANERNSDHAG